VHDTYNGAVAGVAQPPSGEAAGDPDEAFLTSRAAARHDEPMPLRRTAQPLEPQMRLAASSTFCDLATFLMLDNRQDFPDQAFGVRRT
jgi:phosphodiesterase/alkaline phosphatase D-like protein